MHSLRTTTTTLTVLAALIAALALQTPLAASTSPEPNETSEGSAAGDGVFAHLAGSWRLIGMPDPASGISDFVNVFVITRDGKLINVDPAVATGVGETRRIGPRSYAVGFRGFLEMDGQILEYEVESTLESNRARTEASGPFRTLVRDLLGNLLFEYTGEIAATRLPEPVGL